MVVQWRWALLGIAVLVGCGQVPDHAMGAALDGRSCFDCHGDRYLATTAPNHATRGFPRSCEACHATTAWQPATAANHDFWPLTGAHITTTCESCHASGYQGTPTACAGCHLVDYQTTSAPDHETGSFPTACESCHSTEAWAPATFDHDGFWPLRGSHTAVECSSCHVGEVFAGTPRQCVGCHQADYDQTSDPPHLSSQFPTTCEACHTEAGWKPAVYDHNQYWPLLGKHATTPCESCHVGAVYAGTPKQCVACHQADYQGTTSPSHTQLNLSTACETCHTPTSWATNTFPGHDPLFPISNGKHRNFTCSDCHTTANTFSEFTCTGCHTGEHSLQRMNQEHQGEVGNYQATLNQYGVDRGCLHCHPDGRED